LASKWDTFIKALSESMNRALACPFLSRQVANAEVGVIPDCIPKSSLTVSAQSISGQKPFQPRNLVSRSDDLQDRTVGDEARTQLKKASSPGAHS
jgi:hypothetical protein